MSSIFAMTILAKQLSELGCHILFDAASIDAPANNFFEPEYWRTQNALLGVAQGRGAACIFRNQNKIFVLRHYHRGGLMANLNKDRYYWSGLEQTRAWHEWYLLAEMFQQGLPVPQPVAARVQRHGLFYSADLVMLCLPDVTPLADLLMQAVMPERQWQLIGATIKRFHQAGIYHADLNARNILLDQAENVFLIDFDKGERRASNTSWQQVNLTRLRRSLHKFVSAESQFYFDEKSWQCLLAGYAK